jgi:hypothetical protein
LQVNSVTQSKGKGKSGRKGKGGRAHSLKRPFNLLQQAGDVVNPVNHLPGLKALFGKKNLSSDARLLGSLLYLGPVTGTTAEVIADREIQVQTGGQVNSLREATVRGFGGRTTEELKKNQDEVVRRARGSSALTDIARNLPGVGDVMRPIAGMFGRFSGVTPRQTDGFPGGSDVRESGRGAAHGQFSSSASRSGRNRNRDRQARNRQNTTGTPPQQPSAQPQSPPT